MYLPGFLRKGFSEPRAGAMLDRTAMEMGAYEALWLRPGATFKTVGEWLAAAEGGLASVLAGEEEAERSAREVLRRFAVADAGGARIKLHGEPDFPAKLGDARHPLRAFYYRGDLDLLATPSVAVVGARQLSEQGAARTRRLVRHLVEDGFTIVSGMAAGTDAVAHATALAMGGRTIAVLGTPIHKVYPRQNAGLQAVVAERFLAVSQVPVLLHEAKDWRYNRKFFPERNVTMSALTDASIIVEIGDSNGTFIQSKAALDQGRPLFLLNNCFRKKGISWPAQFARRGAVRATDYEDIGSRIRHLAKR